MFGSLFVATVQVCAIVSIYLIEIPIIPLIDLRSMCWCVFQLLEIFSLPIQMHLAVIVPVALSPERRRFGYWTGANTFITSQSLCTGRDCTG